MKGHKSIVRRSIGDKLRNLRLPVIEPLDKAGKTGTVPLDKAGKIVKASASH